MKKQKNGRGITLSDFARKIKVPLEVEKMSEDRFTCSFKYSEITDGKDLKGFLWSAYGSGVSRYAAKRDYAIKIQGKILVINAGSPKCRRLNVPKLKF